MSADSAPLSAAWAAVLPERVASLRRDLAAHCAAAGRDPASLRLIAVTKTVDAAVLPALAAAGVADLGENRVEHLATMVAAAGPGPRFHFIGRLQGRQIPQVAAQAAVLHSLHDPAHIERLARACRVAERQLEVFVQVAVGGEAQKAGIAPSQLSAMLDAARAQADAFSVVGLMTMAPDLAVPGVTRQRVADCFGACRDLAARHGLLRLSMGMSGDLDLAIAAGATEVRVGSRLFAQPPAVP